MHAPPGHTDPAQGVARPSGTVLAPHAGSGAPTGRRARLKVDGAGWKPPHPAHAAAQGSAARAIGRIGRQQADETVQDVAADTAEGRAGGAREPMWHAKQPTSRHRTRARNQSASRARVQANVQMVAARWCLCQRSSVSKVCQNRLVNWQHQTEWCLSAALIDSARARLGECAVQLASFSSGTRFLFFIRNAPENKCPRRRINIFAWCLPLAAARRPAQRRQCNPSALFALTASLQTPRHAHSLLTRAPTRTTVGVRLRCLQAAASGIGARRSPRLLAQHLASDTRRHG